MTAVANAIMWRDAVITIDGTTYEGQVRKARLVPAQDVTSYRVSTPTGTIQDVNAPVWTLELEGVQINHSNGLAKALRDAADAGDTIDVIVQPKRGSAQPTGTVTVIPLQVPFGGEEGKIMDFDITLPVNGSPTWGTSA